MSRHRKKLIYLLGFMGSGKTTVGALLAQELGWPFIDLDATLEAGQGKSIREIFEQAGEPFFRELERAALTEASRTQPAVIALGGGTFVQKPNLEFIRETGGATIWLDCPVEELQHRCEGLATRPLFRDPMSFRRLYEERLPFYQLAEFRVATAGKGPQEIVSRILQMRVF
jgi:shikimate kinase